jgi:hypothetical protein
MRRAGKIILVDLFGVGFIESTGTQYAFTFDKIQNYRGEQPQQLGLQKGCPVEFEADGLEIKSVVILGSLDPQAMVR